MNVSRIFTENIDAYEKGYRVILNQGGTSSTKTYSLLQIAYIIAKDLKERRLISIMSPTLPHARRGALRDFMNILEDEGAYDEGRHNKTNLTFQIGNSEVEFFSADQPGKVRGPRRDILIVNELNLIKKETFEQALIRTRECCFADYNPVSQFYAHTDYLPRPDCLLIKSTFRDNPFLSDSIIDEILSRRNNTNWWRVYGEGEVGQVEGLVYPRYTITGEIPPTATLVGYGMDFGYTNSPTSVIAVYKHKGALLLHELVYRRGLLTSETIEAMKKAGVKTNKPIIADSEDPRLIKEINNAGFICRGIKKPKVFARIEKALNYELQVTAESENLLHEFANYMWMEKDGEYLQEPVKAFDHGMDAWGYAVWELVDKKGVYIF